MASQCSDLTWTSNFFDLVLFLLLSLVTGPKFMSISSLVLELWQFSFIRDWAEIWRSEIPSFEFCPISGDWSELWTPHLARMSLIECYWMLQNSRVTTFTIFELLRENQVGGKITPPHTPRLGLIQAWIPTRIVRRYIFFDYSCIFLCVFCTRKLKKIKRC